jgi:hypothetical protein
VTESKNYRWIREQESKNLFLKLFSSSWHQLLSADDMFTGIVKPGAFPLQMVLDSSVNDLYVIKKNALNIVFPQVK